ncbi:MAG: amine oxidase, partial [Gammaproteobacteria bacterium]
MRIVVLGSGPTGLGAGWRLNQSGHDDWRLFDRMDRIGGLSTSYVDEAGFTWDVGGHVLFSHFELFDGVVEKALGGDYYSH